MARKRDRAVLVQWANESSVFLVQLLSLLVLWASWKELKEQVRYITSPEKCTEELCPKCLLVQRTHTCPTEKVICLEQVNSIFFALCIVIHP